MPIRKHYIFYHNHTESIIDNKQNRKILAAEFPSLVSPQRSVIGVKNER